MPDTLTLPSAPPSWLSLHGLKPNVANLLGSTGTGETCAREPSYGLNAAERWIINRESGNNVNAQNPNSTAFGLGQLTKANRTAYAKILGVSPNTTDYASQLAMFRMYVSQRYGNITNALRHWQLKGWY
jgi:hypothetical protein